MRSPSRVPASRLWTQSPLGAATGNSSFHLIGSYENAPWSFTWELVSRFADYLQGTPHDDWKLLDVQFEGYIIGRQDDAS